MKQLELEYVSLQAIKKLNYKIYSLKDGKMDFIDFLNDFNLKSLN